jgi:hypothetical protein
MEDHSPSTLVESSEAAVSDIHVYRPFDFIPGTIIDRKLLTESSHRTNTGSRYRIRNDTGGLVPTHSLSLSAGFLSAPFNLPNPVPHDSLAG